MEAKKYLNELPLYQWLNLLEAPENLQETIGLFIQTNIIEEYRLTQHEFQANLFMKSRRTEKVQLLDALEELKRGLSLINWVYISTKEDNYIVTIKSDGAIIDTNNLTTNKVFKPESNILDYADWIYKHGINIKLKYNDNTSN